MDTPENVEALVEEYRVLLKEAVHVSPAYFDWKSDKVEDVLIRDCEWSPKAAGHLLQLVNDYGTFMLRNALALSLALGIEDGELGF
jgi:hypothetical protein